MQAARASLTELAQAAIWYVSNCRIPRRINMKSRRASGPSLALWVDQRRSGRWSRRP